MVATVAQQAPQPFGAGAGRGLAFARNASG